MSMQQAYPLAWPPGWPRTVAPARSAFAERSVFSAIEEVKWQLELTKCTSLVISSSATLGATPKDKGICVYFQLKGKPYALPCDKWDLLEDNLWAISKHIESLRLQERWGVGSIERAFAGYLALPAPADGSGWWDVLGISRDASPALITAAYRSKAQLNHPDMPSGSTEAMARVNQAYADAKIEKGTT